MRSLPYKSRVAYKLVKSLFPKEPIVEHKERHIPLSCVYLGKSSREIEDSMRKTRLEIEKRKKAYNSES